MTTVTARKGDIFRWHWIGDAGGFMPSHCCAHIARFNGKVLRDTYWHGVSDGKTFKLEDVGKRISVTFIANEDELEQLSDHAQPEKYYDPEQIVDLNHPNSTRGNLYLRKGSERSAEVMRKAVERMIDVQEHRRDCAKGKIEELKDQLVTIDREPLNGISLLGLSMDY